MIKTNPSFNPEYWQLTARERTQLMYKSSEYGFDAAEMCDRAADGDEDILDVLTEREAILAADRLPCDKLSTAIATAPYIS